MQQLDIYKKVLTEEREEITAQLESLGIHNPHVPSDWITLPDQINSFEADSNLVADRVEDWVDDRGTLNALETRYNNVVRALARIEEDAFGKCEICGEIIEADRLSANPAARTCKTHLEAES